MDLTMVDYMVLVKLTNLVFTDPGQSLPWSTMLKVLLLQIGPSQLLKSNHYCQELLIILHMFWNSFFYKYVFQLT